MKKIQVLYVDDEANTLNIMKIGLEERGYSVLISDNGSDALELMKTNKPDVIIADLRMNPMNGFDLFQEMKKIEKFSRIPFIFLTAVDDFLAQKYSQTLGVDAYITKPVDLGHLDTLIRRRISAKL